MQVHNDTQFLQCSLCGESSAGLLDEFYQNATGFHVGGKTDRLPSAKHISGDGASAALSIPPSTMLYYCYYYYYYYYDYYDYYYHYHYHHHHYYYWWWWWWWWWW